MKNLIKRKKLKIARVIVGLELRDLAKILDCDYSYLSKMETGSRKVTKKATVWSNEIIKRFVKDEFNE